MGHFYYVRMQRCWLSVVMSFLASLSSYGGVFLKLSLWQVHLTSLFGGEPMNCGQWNLASKARNITLYRAVHKYFDRLSHLGATTYTSMNMTFWCALYTKIVITDYVLFCMFLLYCCLCGVINDDDDESIVCDLFFSRYLFTYNAFYCGVALANSK